jgi:hypothetical protein
VIASYALSLNDAMWDDELRQELLVPFVTRLAGTADAKEIELKRVRHIALQAVKRVLPIPLRLAGLTQHAERCESVNSLVSAADAAAAAQTAANAIESVVWDARSAASAAICAARAAAYAGDLLKQPGVFRIFSRIVVPPCRQHGITLEIGFERRLRFIGRTTVVPTPFRCTVF